MKNKRNGFDAIIFNPVLHPDIIMYPSEGVGLTYARLTPIRKREMRIGAGGYTSLMMAKLGIDCCCIDRIGSDIFGDFTIEEMRKHGLNMDYVSRFNGDHMVCVILVSNGEGGTMMCSYPETFVDITYDDFMSMLDRSPDAKILYLYSWFWSFFQPNMLNKPTSNIIKKAKDKGYKIILDVNYKTKEAPPAHELNELIKSMPYIDYLLPNAFDAEIIVGNLDPISTVKELNELGVNQVILKMGEHGSYINIKDKVKNIRGYNVNVLDTTGAGDMFGGALTYGVINKLDIEEIVKISNAAAAYGISHASSQKYPNISALESFINSYSGKQGEM